MNDETYRLAKLIIIFLLIAVVTLALINLIPSLLTQHYSDKLCQANNYDFFSRENCAETGYVCCCNESKTGLLEDRVCKAVKT